MGVDFTAILDHQLSWEELVVLPDILNAIWRDPPGAAAVHPNIEMDRTPWRWSLDRTFSSAAEELFDAAHVSLDGRVGFGATVFRQAVELTHLVRWWSFVFEPGVRQTLLEGAALLAHALRSTTIIYLPDSGLASAQGSDLVFEGATAAEIVEWLGTNIGPAAPNIDALGSGSRDLNEHGYFVAYVRPAG
jgi:hypothetical protein